MPRQRVQTASGNPKRKKHLSDIWWHTGEKTEYKKSLHVGE
jgi:hypothetical protein